jgi:hypothetical protein
MLSITAQLARGRRAARVIDLANGPDEAPEPVMMSLPPWPGRVAHTRAGDETIYMYEQPVGPADPVDMRCGSCTAQPEVGLDHQHGLIIFMIHHQPRCQAVNDLLAMAGGR